MRDTGIVTTAVKEGSWAVAIEGQLTEETTLPTPPAGVRAAKIDLGRVDYINSTGVRNWLLWIKNLKESMGAESGVELTKAPLAFLRLMELVDGMLPEGSCLRSFQISYSCLDCAKVHHMEAENSPDLAGTIAVLNGATTPACANCQSETDLEMDPRFYLALSKFAPK